MRKALVLSSLLLLNACADAPKRRLPRDGDTAPPQATQPYDLPAERTLTLTNYSPGQPTGFRATTQMTFGQLETYQIVLTIPQAFTFNGFDALGPAGSRVGSYGFDFDNSTPGVPDRVLPLRSVNATQIYADTDLSGAYEADTDAVIDYSQAQNGDHLLTATIPLGGDGSAGTITAFFDSGIILSLFSGFLTNPGTAGDYVVTADFTSVDPDTDGANDNAGEGPEMLQVQQTLSIANSPLRAAVLPTSRSVVFGQPATAFATISNSGASVLNGCGISPASSLTATLSYQTTDPSTNALTGSIDTPVSIPAGGSQSFLIALTPIEETFFGDAQAFPPIEVEFLFSCTGATPAPTYPGVNTLLLSADTTQAIDVIAITASASGDGYVRLGDADGVAAFGVAGLDIGAAGTVTVQPRAGLATTASSPELSAPQSAQTVDASVLICETTNSIAGTCLAAPSASVQSAFASNDVRTYSIFVQGNGSEIADNPANNRIFVDFIDSQGDNRGMTSIAVTTVSPPD
ncbi:hypothetical protein V0U79_02705 [Hyphobacterium sp. HN65]|uniref:Choice-of-anchor D domain-containing protein n=1 Tax=Hyphobacterium lacteum TaxID=3116575 RepID=A0ABU7LMV8_9PROT|nr:hypothetical protein [Hyphobacterium sp. HN65]MEE2525260.1 hypothetical protein [Hyphobacterium sp. HN65]